MYLGNMIGSLLYAGLFYLVITNWQTGNGGAVADLVKQAAQKKTLGFAALGGSGWALALVKGILCNWMVTIGAMFALVSRSTVGKIVAMWLPILTFFALGFEHSVVNMYILPSGMMLGAAISVEQVLFWNLVPVTLGNIIAGALFTGVPLYVTCAVKSAPTVVSVELPAAESANPAVALAAAATPQI